MRKLFPGVMIFLVLSIYSGAQDSQVLLNTFQRNFQRAEQIEIKLKILEDSVKAGPEGLGPLYLNAVDYVIDHSSLLATDALVIKLAHISVEQIRVIEYTQAANSMWRLFKETEDTVLRAGILKTLGVIAGGNDTIARRIIEWLDSQNSLLKAGGKPDLPVIPEAVAALGILKNNTAFSVIFTTMEIYSQESIRNAARKALLSLEGDYKENLMKVVREGTLVERFAALKMGLNDGKLSDLDKAEIAEAGLEVGVYTTTGNKQDQATNREMRMVAVQALSKSNWSRATPLVIEHFGMALLEYERSVVSKGFLLDAINGLGNMQTHEAAERLALYLELINSYTEHGRAYDEQIVLAVLANLKILGDKVAFANLSYTQYLNYSDTVKAVAQDAIDHLKW
ncbi:MAG TPA: hypothetical protein VMX75_04795 [Spirochaetia bacterium]|nr:hypothetical protein [Spirochaetia bacterium]